MRREYTEESKVISVMDLLAFVQANSEESTSKKERLEGQKTRSGDEPESFVKSVDQMGPAIAPSRSSTNESRTKIDSIGKPGPRKRLRDYQESIEEEGGVNESPASKREDVEERYVQRHDTTTNSGDRTVTRRSSSSILLVAPPQVSEESLPSSDDSHADSLEVSNKVLLSPEKLKKRKRGRPRDVSVVVDISALTVLAQREAAAILGMSESMLCKRYKVTAHEWQEY